MPDETDSKIQNSLINAILKILTPLVRIMIRYGVTYSQFADATKQTFYRIASNEFKIPDKKQTISRIATLTGLSRKEVGIIKENKKTFDIYSPDRQNRAMRVISTWKREPEYQNKRGSPLSLTFEGDGPNFTTLVKRSAVDVPPKAILNELIRSGTVKKLTKDKYVLLNVSYIPHADKSEIIEGLGIDVSNMIKTIDHNLICEPEKALFQRRSLFDNIPADKLELLKREIFKTMERTIVSITNDIAKYDRDADPNVEGEGRKVVGINLTYFDWDYDENE